MNRKSSDELKPKKTNKGFFSKFWKFGSTQTKADKKKISKSVDNLKDFINEESIQNENVKELNEILNNSKRKSKSLDLLNDNVDVECIKMNENVEKENENKPVEKLLNSKRKSKSLDIINIDIEEIIMKESIEQENVKIQNGHLFDNEDIKIKDNNDINEVVGQEIKDINNNSGVIENDNNKSCSIDSNNVDKVENTDIQSVNNDVFVPALQEQNDNECLKSNDLKVEDANPIKNDKNLQTTLSAVQEEQECIISNKVSEKEDNDKIEEIDTNKKENSNPKSNLTILIDNKDIKNEVNGLTSKEFADILYNMEETEYEGKQISLILTEPDKYHEETLKNYMKNFDFNNIEIDEALRILCKKVVIIGETQQIDRILNQFSKHYFESNLHRQEIFLNEDVTHSIVYSLVLLNTDLHIVYNDNPNKKMTKKEFLKNTMTLLESMSENCFSPQMKIKSANIPNRKSYFDSPTVQSIDLSYTSSTLPRNFVESQENKQKKWKKQMEQLLSDLYNSIKTKRIIQRTATGNEADGGASYNGQYIQSQSADAYPNKIQSLFGNEKSNNSTLTSMKNLISKVPTKKSKEKNIYLSLPSLNASDSASYNSYGDSSYSIKSFDKHNTISKSTNGINLSKNANAKIVQKGALSRKHFMDQGKQRAKDRRWSKAHCALFIDPEISQNGICELRIWLESTSTSSAKKKGTTNKDFDELFETTANEDDEYAQNLPYLNPNYHEVLPITHSVTSVVKNYTSFTSTIRKNIFSLKLSSGSTYLFEALDEDNMKTWVNALNFWAARKSKEPLRGAVGNMEYGWNQVEKIEKPKSVTPEEIQEPIPIYDPFENFFDGDSIKSYASSNRDKNSRESSIRSGRSGRSTSNNNRNDNLSIKDLNLTSLPESNNSSSKEERTARSFTIKRLRSSSRSTSRHTELSTKSRSISLSRNESRNTKMDLRSYSCSRHSSYNKTSNLETSNMPTIFSNTNSKCNSSDDLQIKSDITHSPLTSPSDNNQTSPLTKEPINNEKVDSKNKESQDKTLLNHSNSSTIENNTLQKKLSITESTSPSDTKKNDVQETTSPVSTNGLGESKDTKEINDINKNIINNVNNESDENTKNEDLKSTVVASTLEVRSNNLLHRRILSEPELRRKRNIDKNGTKKRSQSLSQYTENVNKSINSIIIPMGSSIVSVTPDNSKSKLEESIIEVDSISQYSTLPYKRSQKIVNQLASKHQSFIPDKFFNINAQRFSIQPGGTLTIKKKIKKLRICDWTQPGVGFLLSTLTLEKQYESMKKQYLITEKEIKYHKNIKQPMEDLYVFQSSAYQKAINNWKKKYIYLLDEKNKYGLYVNMLENYMKIDPNEERLFPIVEERKYSNVSSVIPETIETDTPSQTTASSSHNNNNNNNTSSPDKNLSETASQDEIKNILARKRQQQLDIMKKTANDLSIDSGKLENSFILPEINVGNSLFDDEYEKEMEELAMEQERIFNLKK
ncbi:hypothetical protein BCR36DRAFT_585802 [Piromyces finnis]|uniref:SEC7 domain-containing protein n=1 Tax=Piromyces finnis TaxID=1754191 RepID=A0A1Y1V301_9FUNG|nr:hypothetical protein BCR36DRAFT_585802 [Piromyces finnis]|eukprot:ORX45188.1 hypothetical protein BCR36DRAFT_585802 [Piromyces finnis]